MSNKNNLAQMKDLGFGIQDSAQNNKNSFSQLLQTSALSGANATYLEELYEEYLQNPASVASEWRNYFAKLGSSSDIAHTPIRWRFAALGQQTPRVIVESAVSGLDSKQAQVTRLINDYRLLGHLKAKIDPLNLMSIPNVPELTLNYHQLTAADLNVEFDAAGACGMARAPLSEIIQRLEQTYCGSIGAEIMHISNTERRRWLMQRFEAQQGKPQFSSEEKIRLLEKLIAAHGLEKYLGTKYVGQKRFSIEGADSLIPMMDALTYHGAKNGVKEIIVGMAHRGRLNMLVNFLGKAPATLFNEFEGKIKDQFSGDVKYHKGFSSNINTPYGTVHLAMAYNPSHLEAVNPVVEGAVRAKQWRRDDNERQKILPVLLHGDASFSGQGVVQETFNLSQVHGYTTGGTVHIVINNQVGFTTSVQEGRSTLYCTDIAKMVDAPILHINGDDPEACVFGLQLLYDYRKQFQQDIVIDLVCYRQHGHNEADDPTMTQPVMYHVIKQHPTPYQVYAEKLQQEKIITAADVDKMIQNYRNSLDSGQPVVEIYSPDQKNEDYKYRLNWKAYSETDWRAATKTAVDKKTLQDLGQKLVKFDSKFVLQPQVAKVLANRQKMLAGEMAVDWGFAENLAYASLLTAGYPVRLSGEDVQRGTFGHRHVMFHHYETGETYMPLMHLDAKQAPFWAYNSILSEYAVMGFEVGYAAAAPETLVIWEAQYGDFANGAQIIIDQFISSGEQKWKQQSGLVLFLPHGYEGSGPEHSSARLERYLQLCAQHNMQVCMPTTPAQMFHMLRRQMLRMMRKPLIVMTMKSLLRSPLAASPLADLCQGNFATVIDETDTDISADKVQRVVLCAGKVYYDLLQKRREEKITNIALVRIEQLYPFPDQELAAVLKRYSKAKEVIWAQEEPLNQGVWYSMQHNMRAALVGNQILDCVTRPDSAAPAGGYMATHLERQKKVVNDALRIKN